MSPAFLFGPLAVVAVGVMLMVREVRRARPLQPVKAQAPTADFAAFNRGWREAFPADAPNVVEDDEVLDAWITDEHCAELDDWYGIPVLPGTPIVVQALAQL
jgi:hypothetical protein